MTCKDIIKYFWEYISEHHPIKDKYQGGAFVIGNALFLIIGSESTLGTDRDASHATKDTLSNLSN